MGSFQNNRNNLNNLNNNRGKSGNRQSNFRNTNTRDNRENSQNNNQNNQANRVGGNNRSGGFYGKRTENARDCVPAKREVEIAENGAEAEVENTVIYGRNAVMEALLAEKTADTVYVLKGAGGLGKHIALAKESGAVVKDVSEEKLNSLIPEAGKSGGIVAVMAAAEYSAVEDILAESEKKGMPPFIIIADEIQDPHNLGALIRTAEAAGADGLIIPKRRSAGLTATVFKTSAGAASWLKIARVPNLTDAIKELKSHNIWVYGAEADGVAYDKANLSGGVALVIGSEGYGLGRLVRESCDGILSIDMYGKVNSLNASVSGGILMYEVVRARRNAKKV